MKYQNYVFFLLGKYISKNYKTYLLYFGNLIRTDLIHTYMKILNKFLFFRVKFK